MNVKNLFKYNEPKNYNFTLTSYDSYEKINEDDEQSIYPSFDLNLNYIKKIYNIKVNSDIVLREFSLTAKNTEYKAFIIYIDGMVDSNLINRFVLNPLMIRNDNNTFNGSLNQNIKDNICVKKVKKFNLEEYIYSHLMPQNTVNKEEKFSDIIKSINSGNCALFVDTVSVVFNIDAKGFKQRNVEAPTNEIVIQGPQEAFVENIRTNTSLLRRIEHNENLVIESLDVGNISKTNVAICYMANIANPNLVDEVRYRVSNLSLDTLFSTGQLEQLIDDNDNIGIPSILSTERPDKCSKFLAQGRVIILVNGNPYAIVVPAVLIDFLSSPEDTNLKVTFANFLKCLRFLAYFITLLAPRNLHCNYKLSSRATTYRAIVFDFS